MKKILFLLLMTVALAVFVSAEGVNGPGVLSDTVLTAEAVPTAEAFPYAIAAPLEAVLPTASDGTVMFEACFITTVDYKEALPLLGSRQLDTAGETG